MARNNTEQLTKMVTDLLDLSKIEAGKMTISLKPLSIGEPIEKAVTNLRPQAEEKGVTLDLSLASDLPLLYGDVASIRRVMANLVGNAIKFTDTGGAVRVQVSETPRGAGTSEPDAVTVSVSDTGVGIPKEHLQSIFDKFHQVEGQRSKEVVGTGLGLPIVQELVKAHHGTISVESEPERGSCFTFTIPVLSPEDLFFRSLNQDMERAQRLASPLSLVVIRIADAVGLVSKLGAKGSQELLDRLEHWVRKETVETTARSLLCRDQGEILTVLPRTACDAATSFGQRLCEGMRSDSEVNADIDLTWSAAAFPEDGATAEKLLLVARERITTQDP
jgi:two-component sensor histidine kinase